MIKINIYIIKKKKKSTLSISQLPFQKLIIQIVRKQKKGMRINTEALDILQKATEKYLVSLFEDSKFLAINNNKTTVVPKYIELAKRIRGY